MFNRYHHAYQINQEKVQKSLLKSLFIVMKFQTPSPFSVGPDVILCDFFAKNDFLLNSIDTVVLSSKIMGFKFSTP